MCIHYSIFAILLDEWINLPLPHVWQLRLDKLVTYNTEYSAPDCENCPSNHSSLISPSRQNHFRIGACPKDRVEPIRDKMALGYLDHFVWFFRAVKQNYHVRAERHESISSRAGQTLEQRSCRVFVVDHTTW